MKALSIPNIITSIRIVIIPLFVISIIYKNYSYALLLFVFAAVSDALDGLLARATKQKTKLGAFLDAFADKFLLATAFILFSVYNLIPLWLTITVISRDLIVMLGWLLLYFLYNEANVAPSIIGKMAIASQLILIVYILLSINFISIPQPDRLMFYAVAALTVTSGVQYIYRGFEHLNEKQLRR